MTEANNENFIKAAGSIESGALDETLDAVTAWLGRLVLLYGVPFNYLIPDEEMLPKESIRFFYLDPIWIQCLLQGACNFGNNGYGDSIVDRVLNQWVQPSQPGSGDDSSRTLNQAASVRDRLRHQLEGVELPEQNQDIDWPLTGFLLRSAVVEGWRGMEVMAYRELSGEERKRWNTKGMTEEQLDKFEKEGMAPLKPLRIEQLAPDVLFGIFNGRVEQLLVRQPQEGLHFGLTPVTGADGPSFLKTLRNMGFKDSKLAGQNLKTIIDLSEESLLRDSQPQKGVIKMGALANRMKQALSEQGQLLEGKFTSAEFAVQMIEAPGEFTFQPDHKSQR